MSREGAGDKRKTKAPPAAGTPIWVWVVYAFGILAATIFVVSILFTVGAVFLSGDQGVSYRASTFAIVLWGGLMAVAGGLWIWRRRR